MSSVDRDSGGKEMPNLPRKERERKCNKGLVENDSDSRE